MEDKCSKGLIKDMKEARELLELEKRREEQALLECEVDIDEPEEKEVDWDLLYEEQRDYKETEVKNENNKDN